MSQPTQEPRYASGKICYVEIPATEAGNPPAGDRANV